MMRRAVGLAALTLGLLRGQDGAPAFEVASVRPSLARGVPPAMQIHPGGFRAVHVFPRALIAEAYGVWGNLISGGPAWIDSEAFDIEGRAAGPVDAGQVKAMLQSLLADRFKLKARRETKELTVSHMTMPKPSSKLVAAKDPEGPAGVRWSPLMALVRRSSMADIARMLQSAVGHTVIDETGIAGEFDIEVETTPEAPFKSVADAILAVPRQVGLKLETGKGPVETIVIASMERPEGN